MRVHRRGGRAVECTGLENRRGFIPTQGSNPCPSAIFFRHKHLSAGLTAPFLPGIRSDHLQELRITPKQPDKKTSEHGL